MKPTRLRLSRRGTRRPAGLAVVELAVCLPIIVVLVFGSIEACSMIFIKQSLHVAVYEGVRKGIVPEASNADVVARCEAVLRERNVRGATIDVEPANLAELTRGNLVVVSITVPASENAILQGRFFRNSLQAEATMVRE